MTCECGKDHTDSKPIEEVQKEVVDQLAKDIEKQILDTDKQILELIIRQAKGKENNENIY
jgi:hypothetical protein